MPGPAEEPTDMPVSQGQPSPPGEFVSEDLERDCARFLEELRQRANRSEEIRTPSEK